MICVALVASAMTAALGGCSNRAHRDLYQQRLAMESRILEDQLYEADYENRRLRDQLEQYQRKVAEAQIPTPGVMKPHDHPNELGRRSPLPSASIHSPIADPATNLPADDLGNGLDTEDFDLPMFDDGEPVDASELGQPEPIPAPKPDKPSSVLPAPKKPNPETTAPRQPAPGLPVPPSKRDTEIPPIIPGDILPPPRDNKDELPPGQIVLPDFTNAKSGVPEKLSIHPTLSSGHHTDGKLDGAVIVIGAVDGMGRPVDLSGFDVDADLSVVILDPTRDGNEARIGRWEFTRSQVQSLVREHPVSGLHVAIQWTDDAPNGDNILVHARLRGDDSDMRCEGELKLGAANQPTITDWTPRGSKLR